MRAKLAFIQIGLVIVMVLGATGVAQAVDNIVVVALFKDKAVLTVDGKRRVLAVGEASPEGVKLVSADSEEAVLEVAGRRDTYPLGMHIATGFAGPRSQEVQIFSTGGMYRTTGSINGHLVDFLVDTGATTIAMNSAYASRLGLDFRYRGERVKVETASGVVDAYAMVLNTVKVGEIELRNVEAMILDGSFPSDVLLGMSFLGRLDMQHQGQTLVLKKKY